MKVFDSNKLTHTLQTWCGMVLGQGLPQRRPTTRLPQTFLLSNHPGVQASLLALLSDEEIWFLFIPCVLQGRIQKFLKTDKRDEDAKAQRFNSNVYACCDSGIDVDFMKRNVRALNRLDLEQAAAVVITSIRNDVRITNRGDIVAALIKELDTELITESCMWLESHQRNPGATVQEAKFARLVDMVGGMLGESQNSTEKSENDILSHVEDWASLVPLLLRVRRKSPQSRCLFIPQWIFEAADVKPPSQFMIWSKDGTISPGHEPIASSVDEVNDVILSRKRFRSLQRRLLRFHRFWHPNIRLRKAIRDFEANVVFGAEHLRSMVMPSQDTLVVAHYFFALQRRLQRKVVSDLQWTGFLEKGQSGLVLQNNPNIPTTFEQRLSHFSGEAGVPVTGPVVPQIDQCCLLMEEYVSVYGGGDRRKLTFVPGVRGGSGRGAVDDYNLLCDILRTLNKAAKEQGLPHPELVRKFLAKDIMSYNNSFHDDAFANDTVPGWEKWLVKRREIGVLEGMKNLEIGRDVVMTG